MICDICKNINKCLLCGEELIPYNNGYEESLVCKNGKDAHELGTFAQSHFFLYKNHNILEKLSMAVVLFPYEVHLSHNQRTTEIYYWENKYGHRKLILSSDYVMDINMPEEKLFNKLKKIVILS